MIKATIRDWHLKTSLKWKPRDVVVELVRPRHLHTEGHGLYVLCTDSNDRRIVLAFSHEDAKRFASQALQSIT